MVTEIMVGKMKLKSNIAALRDEAGLTQLDLSRLVGVTETTIANWEKGRSGLEWIERLIRLCKALNCAPEDLLDLTVPASAEASDPSLADLRQLLGTTHRSPATAVGAKPTSPDREARE